MKDDNTINLKGCIPTANLAVTCLLLLTNGLSKSCTVVTPFINEEEEGINLYLTSKSSNEGAESIENLDIFVFDADTRHRLDSYIHVNTPSSPYIRLMTRNGEKDVVVLANMPEGRMLADDIMSYESLESLWVDLSDEDPEHPVMSGEGSVTAGIGTYTTISLSPLLCNICIESIDCDFSGKGYTSTTLENAVAYLANVSGRADVMRNDGFKISEMLNYVIPDSSMLKDMKHPEMLLKRFSPGRDSFMNLYCYPNDESDGSLGNEHTRLVIRGDIDGETYYYPMEINRDGFGHVDGREGLNRNVKYNYSLHITRKGNTNPQELISIEDVVYKGWMELHPGQFISASVGDKIHVWCELYPENTTLDISREDLDYDVERGIYSYTMDSDGHGVTLELLDRGTGMFTIDAGTPVNDGYLVIVVVN